MSNENAEVLAAFTAEATDALVAMENEFLAMEMSGVKVDDELVNRVFRGIHSMKGTAGYLGLTTIGELAHKVEGILGLIRDHKIAPDERSTEALLGATDSLKHMVENIESSDETDISGPIELLARITVAGDAPAEDPRAQEQAPDKPVAENRTPLDQPEETRGWSESSTLDGYEKVSAPAGTRAPTVKQSLRVNVELLDTLMTLAGELVLGRNQLLQVLSMTAL